MVNQQAHRCVAYAWERSRPLRTSRRAFALCAAGESCFAFVVSDQELAILKSQIATSSWGGKRKRKRPWAFTEHGALMAATLLRSTRAIEVSVYVVRAFVELREALAAHKEIARRVDQLERKVGMQDGTIRDALGSSGRDESHARVCG